MSRTLEPDDPRHGTVNAYNNLGCRCDPCKAAQSEQNARTYLLYGFDTCVCGRSKRRVAALCRTCYDEKREAQHGTEPRYKRGCRCDECRRASAERRRARRKRVKELGGSP